MDAPITFEWTGEAMKPLPRFVRQCQAFAVGQTYPMVVQEERSSHSHRHFFACVRDAWLNLPEDIAVDFPSAEHLRKWALVKSGHSYERSVVCASEQEARRIASFVGPLDEYAIVSVRENIVQVFTAKSQSTKAMSKQEFYESKNAVLDVLANLIGVDPAQLSAQGGQAA